MELRSGVLSNLCSPSESRFKSLFKVFKSFDPLLSSRDVFDIVLSLVSIERFKGTDKYGEGVEKDVAGDGEDEDEALL